MKYTGNSKKQVRNLVKGKPFTGKTDTLIDILKQYLSQNKKVLFITLEQTVDQIVTRVKIKNDVYSNMTIVNGC